MFVTITTLQSVVIKTHGTNGLMPPYLSLVSDGPNISNTGQADDVG